jgi:hypothetical protein
MPDDLQPQAPVASTVTIYPAALQDAAALKTSANTALANNDIKGVINVAQQFGTDTPEGSALLKTAQQGQERLNEFKTVIKPITDAKTDGERNIAASSALRNVSENPLYGQALIAFMMGQKEAAFNLATGGVIKTTTEYAKDTGDIIQVRVNAFGTPQSYFDVKQNRVLSPQEYNERGGSVSNIDHTLAMKSAEENRGLYNSAYNQEKERVNAWTQGYSALAPKLKFMDEFYKNIKLDLPPEEYAKLVATQNQSMGQASTKSNASTYFNQITDNKAANKSQKIDAGLAAKLGIDKKYIGAEFSIEGNYLVSKTDGTKVDYGKLKQQTDSASLSSEATQNSQSTLESVLTSKKFQAAIAGKPKEEQARIIQQMRTATQFANEIGSTITDLVDKHGKPSFISLPTAASFMDTQAQSMVQLIQHKQNLEQMAAYSKHFKESADYYNSTKTLPVPGAIGASFVNKAISQEIANNAANKIQDVMKQEFLARGTKSNLPVTDQAKAVAKPVAPPKASLPSGVPQGSTAHGWSPSGQRIYKAPNGTLHTGD